MHFSYLQRQAFAKAVMFWTTCSGVRIPGIIVETRDNLTHNSMQVGLLSWRIFYRLPKLASMPHFGGRSLLLLTCYDGDRLQQGRVNIKFAGKQLVKAFVR